MNREIKWHKCDTMKGDAMLSLCVGAMKICRSNYVILEFNHFHMGSSKVKIGISFKASPFCEAFSNKTQLPGSVVAIFVQWLVASIYFLVTVFKEMHLLVFPLSLIFWQSLYNFVISEFLCAMITTMLLPFEPNASIKYTIRWSVVFFCSS